MGFLGSRGTGSWGTDERPKNFRETILKRKPNGSAPLTAFLAKLRSEKTDDPEFAWWEELYSITRVRADATGASSSSTTLGLVGGGFDLVPGDLLLVEKADQATYDNEICEVSSVTLDTGIVIRRGVAGSTAAGIPASSYLLKIGNRYEEGSNSPSTSTRNPTKVNNYCQIFKTAYEVTRSAKQTKARTGDPLINDKARKMHDHSVAMEQAFLFGRKNETIGPNGKPLRTTAGIRSFLQTNVKVYTTTPTINNFLDVAAPMFDYNTGDAGNERLLLCGNGFLNSFNKLVAGNSQVRINYDKPIDWYGMQLFRITLPQGTLYMRTHPLMNVHPIYTYAAFGVEPSNLRYRYLQDTMPQDNIQANDADTVKGQWLSEVGLEVEHEMTHMYVGNFLVP